MGLASFPRVQNPWDGSFEYPSPYAPHDAWLPSKSCDSLGAGFGNFLAQNPQPPHCFPEQPNQLFPPADMPYIPIPDPEDLGDVRGMSGLLAFLNAPVDPNFGVMPPPAEPTQHNVGPFPPMDHPPHQQQSPSPTPSYPERQIVQFPAHSYQCGVCCGQPREHVPRVRGWQPERSPSPPVKASVSPGLGSSSEQRTKKTPSAPLAIRTCRWNEFKRDSRPRPY